MRDKNPIFTFLETSVIDPMYNSLNFTHIDLLKKKVDNGKIALTSSPIVLKEIYAHIKKELSAKYENLKGLTDSREFLLLKNNKKYNLLSQQYDVNDMINDTFLEFKKLMKDLKVEMLQDNRIPISKLIDMYFQSIPPFGEKDKKAEFPDAIIYLTLQKYLADGIKIHVVSNDNDWQAIQEVDNRFVIHKSIKEYLDYLNQDDTIYDLVKSFLNNKDARDKIIDYFMKYVNNLNFTVKGYDDSIHGMKINYDYEYVEKLNTYDYDYEIDIVEDISLSGDKYIAQVVIMCSCKIDMKCEYFDEENSVWDSENHEYIDKEFGEVIETHELLVPIRILVDCFNDGTYNINSYSIIYGDYDMSELNNATRLKRGYPQYLSKDKFRVLRDFQCPNCKNNLRLDLISGDTTCVCSNNRSMGVEKEYEIDITNVCQNCGKTFKVTGKVWEYPEGALDYEEQIKIQKNEE